VIAVAGSSRFGARTRRWRASDHERRAIDVRLKEIEHAAEEPRRVAKDSRVAAR
jgi:hypothetical protein